MRSSATPDRAETAEAAEPLGELTPLVDEFRNHLWDSVPLNKRLSEEELYFKEMFRDVTSKLRQPQKSISSKYFYDEKGSDLFKKIMTLEEYYLTHCEEEILKKYSSEIAVSLGNAPFDLIELGAGDGSKTAYLIQALMDKNQVFDFHAIDISAKALEQMKNNFRKRIPHFVPHLIQGDFDRAIEILQQNPSRKKIFLFLGSSIGNMTPLESINFLQKFTAPLKKEDLFLIGFDLKKDPYLLWRAYNDSLGITAQFNLNLLERLNRELQANFNIDHFYHHEIYDAQLGAMVSFLVSKRNQTVQIGETLISFGENEFIHTEYSFKYSKQQIAALGEKVQLQIHSEFFDSHKFFNCTLFRKV